MGTFARYEKVRIVDYGIRGRLKSIIPFGDICKGKISFQKFIQEIHLASYKLAPCFAS